MKTPDMTLRVDEPVKAGILRLADALIDDALRCARHPSRDPVEDVHVFRTTTKRLRALLQLIRPVISEIAFERENARLKNAACRLALSRDRAVAGITLKALVKSAPGHLPPGAQSRAGGGADHDEAPANGARRRAMSQAARDLEQARGGLHRLRIEAEGWAAIGPGLLRVYRQARRRMQEASAHPTDLAFHRWRIRVKHLYYQLEWLEPVWPKRFAAMLKRLHRLEEKLGADHDLVVLRKTLKTAPGGFDTPDVRRVKESAARKSKRLRRSSKRLGAKVLGEKPGCFGRQCRRRWHAWENGNWSRSPVARAHSRTDKICPTFSNRCKAAGRGGARVLRKDNQPRWTANSKLTSAVGATD